MLGNCIKTERFEENAMKIKFPYETGIGTIEEAIEYITSGCNDCPRYSGNWDCSGLMATKCQYSANLVMAESHEYAPLYSSKF